MTLAIRFKESQLAQKFLIGFWCFLAVILIAIYILAKGYLPLFMILLLACFFIVIAVLSYRRFRRSFNTHQGIYWDGQQWFLLIKEQKVAIEIKQNTRVLPHWIVLEYKVIDSPKAVNSQFLLPKDRMSDSDFRDLARTLRF